MLHRKLDIPSTAAHVDRVMSNGLNLSGFVLSGVMAVSGADSKRGVSAHGGDRDSVHAIPMEVVDEDIGRSERSSREANLLFNHMFCRHGGLSAHKVCESLPRCASQSCWFGRGNGGGGLAWPSRGRCRRSFAR